MGVAADHGHEKVIAAMGRFYRLRGENKKGDGITAIPL